MYFRTGRASPFVHKLHSSKVNTIVSVLVVRYTVDTSLSMLSAFSIRAVNRKDLEKSIKDQPLLH